MKNSLIIGSTGQLGSELTMALRSRYGDQHVVAGYIEGAEPKGRLLESGPSDIVDITNTTQLASVIKRHKVDTVYNMAALLSVVAESKPQLAWQIGVNGLFNLLEVARELGCAVFTPSSIAAFGNDTPKDNTPQDTLQRPKTMYGVTKVTGELLSDYYFKRYGLDTRSVRFPGLISHNTLPGGGTTDYAVEVYYAAVQGQVFECPIAKDTLMDMMYMPDALDAAIHLMEADPSRLIHRNSFNISAMSLNPELLYTAIRKRYPSFEMRYLPDPVRQAIANSWPNKLDDSCARKEWDWQPKYDLEKMTDEMIVALKVKLMV